MVSLLDMALHIAVSYIDRTDLLRFMILEEVDLVYPLFEVDERGHISLKAFSKWVVRIPCTMHVS